MASKINAQVNQEVIQYGALLPHFALQFSVAIQ